MLFIPHTPTHKKRVVEKSTFSCEWMKKVTLNRIFMLQLSSNKSDIIFSFALSVVGGRNVETTESK